MKNSLLRRVLLALLALVLAFSAAACGSDDKKDDDAASKDLGSITLGGQGFTEADVMTEMYAALLEDAGFDVTIKNYSDRGIYIDDLLSGKMQVSAEYLGSTTEFFNKDINGENAKQVASADEAATLAELNKFGEEKGFTALEPAKAQDANAFAVTKELAEEHDLTTLSDLGASGLKVHLYANADCPDRDDCQKGLESVYGIKISGFDGTGFGSEDTQKSTQNEKDGLALASVGTTAATLDKYDLVILEDDKSLQKAENLVPVVNSAFLASHPEVKTALDALASVLTTEDLTSLIGKVDLEREKAADVAKEYLEDKGLI